MAKFVIMNVSKTKVLCKEGIGRVVFDNEKDAKKEAKATYGVVVEEATARKLLEANRKKMQGEK